MTTVRKSIFSRGGYESLSDVRGYQLSATTQTSSNVRSLGFAAIAVAWTLAGDAGLTAIRGPLRTALGLVVVALTLDLAQYLWLAGWNQLIGYFAASKNMEKVFVHAWPRAASLVLFYGKALVLITAFVYLAMAVWEKLPR